MFRVMIKTNFLSSLIEKKVWPWIIIGSWKLSTEELEGGGFRMGNTCIPVADSCWYMAKPIQYCKVKKKKKNWCFLTVVLEKILESPLDCKEIQPVHPKEYQSWVFIGRTDAKAETPILWPPHAKSWLIGKDPDAGREWGQEEKGMTEDEMAGWHHRLNGHEFGWTPGVGDGQGGLACCYSWGCKESDTTEWLNWLTDWCHKCYFSFNFFVSLLFSIFLCSS